MSEQFAVELGALINHHSLENGSNTPDFILADYLVKCLVSFNGTLVQRAHWYGRQDYPGQPSRDEELAKSDSQLQHWKSEHERISADYEALLRRCNELMDERDGYKGAMQNLAIRLSECEGKEEKEEA
jgi:hypothetical protein